MDATKLQDLEDNIITLKRVLTERDQETNLLRKENQDLHATNSQLKTQLEDYQKDSRKSPIATSDSDETKKKDTQPAASILNSDVTPETKSEYERQIKQLMNERENLETEMWTLRQKLGVRADDTLGERADDTLDDLESQIQDLQEANETSVSNNAKYEWEIHKLLQENGKLKEELSSGKKDLEAENQTLREEVDRLKSVQDGGIMNGGSLDEFGLQREVLALRQDLHLLRDKNHQLNEDNIKLIEHLQDLRRREKEQMMPAPVAQHIPRGILDKNGSRSDEIQLSDYEYRGFSPIHNPADEDKHSVQSSLSGQYSSGNLRPGSRQTDPVYRQFSDALQKRHNSHQISLHDGEIHADRKQHQPRSILRKKEPLISYDYRDDFSKHPPADRYLERSSLSDFGKTPKHSSLAGSNSSLESILDELEQSFGVSVGRSSENRRNQTKSAGAMDLRHRSSRSMSPTSMGSTGFRSISPKPVPTQHNRGLFGMETPRNENFSTLGKHPFAPRNPADIHIHDVVKFARQGGRICKGLVKFVGHLPGRNDTYIGVELDKDDGKHDGTFEGIRYFKCKPNKGVFIAFSKLVMAWGV